MSNEGPCSTFCHGTKMPGAHGSFHTLSAWPQCARKSFDALRVVVVVVRDEHVGQLETSVVLHRLQQQRQVLLLSLACVDEDAGRAISDEVEVRALQLEGAWVVAEDAEHERR